MFRAIARSSRLSSYGTARRWRYRVSGADLISFQQDGYLIVRELLSPAELALVREALRTDTALTSHTFQLSDGAGGFTSLSLWSNPGSGTLGMLTRSERVVRAAERFLGGQVVHYHSKVLDKKPREGGAWNWHQDWGFWYKDYFLRPQMLTAYFAIDPQTLENGCLKLVRASHELGRIDHWTQGDQQGADLERVQLARAELATVDCLLNPGDAVFFHCNTLHASGKNNSDSPRLALASCFTRKSNVQFRDAYIPCYPLDVVPDSQLLETGVKLTPAAEMCLLQPDTGVATARKSTEDYAAQAVSTKTM